MIIKNDYNLLSEAEVRLFSKYIKEYDNTIDVDFLIKNYYDHLFCKSGFISLNPLFVTLKLTNKCNLNCEHCSNKGNKDKSNIDDQMFDVILMNLIKSKVRSVILTGGEPTMHTNFIRYLKKLKDSGFSVGILTNGQSSYNYCISDIASLLDDNDFIQISVDDTNTAYKYIVRSNIDFDILSDSIRKTVSLGARLKTNTVVQTYNVEKLEYIYDYAVSLGVKSMRFTPMFNVGTSASKYPGDVQAIRYFSKVLMKKNHDVVVSGSPIHVFYPFVDWYNKEHKYEKIEVGKFLCPAITTSIEINQNGDVYPCSYLDMKQWHYGNVKTDNLSDIWFKSKTRCKFSNDNNYDNQICLNCSIKDLCSGGCKASSIVNSGMIGKGETNCFYRR